MHRPGRQVCRQMYKLAIRGRGRSQRCTVCFAAGDPETDVEKSPLDYPQEWSVPPPSKRPDIFPEFDPMETPLPNPMPGDPEQPNEEEEKQTEPDPEVEPDDPEEIEPEEDEEEDDESE